MAGPRRERSITSQLVMGAPRISWAMQPTTRSVRATATMSSAATTSFCAAQVARGVPGVVSIFGAPPAVALAEHAGGGPCASSNQSQSASPGETATESSVSPGIGKR